MDEVKNKLDDIEETTGKTEGSANETKRKIAETDKKEDEITKKSKMDEPLGKQATKGIYTVFSVAQENPKLLERVVLFKRVSQSITVRRTNVQTDRQTERQTDSGIIRLSFIALFLVF